MKADPNTACKPGRECMPWSILHDLIAHPLMALSLYSKIARRFHDWTSAHAWPTTPRAARVAPFKHWQRCEFGRLVAVQQAPFPDEPSPVGFWMVVHPRTGHRVVSYGLPHECMSRAVHEFREWRRLFGDKHEAFNPFPGHEQAYAELRAMEHQ